MNKSKNKIKTVAYSPVIADLFHYGHLRVLLTAKEKFDFSIVGLLTDAAANKFRKKVISNFDERQAVLNNIKCIDEVWPQKDIDPTENLKHIHKKFPDAQIVLVHGNNWDYVPGQEYIYKIKGRIVKPDYYERLGDLNIIKELKLEKINFEFFTEHFKINDIEYFDSDDSFKTIITTKANTLKVLKTLLKFSKIEKTFVFNVTNWLFNKDKIISEIQKIFKQQKIVIRSSALNEDSYKESNAGVYKSILNINPQATGKLKRYIEEVISSYNEKDSFNLKNQVLVQKQTTNVAVSGVLFTRQLDSNAPYYVINYDDITGRTDTVTGGSYSKKIEISRFISWKKLKQPWKKIIGSVREIETIIPKIPLDIEFALTRQNDFIIFQVRPIVSNLGKNREILDLNIKKVLSKAVEKFRRLNSIKKRSHLCGNRTFLSDMAFWNPAEMIGSSPNELAYSLYEYLITKRMWNSALAEMGYYDLKNIKLMHRIYNHPYIDIRAAFNALLPEKLSSCLKNKLVNYYLGKLKENPELHDKIEFEIVFSCYDFNFSRTETELLKNGFSVKQISIIKKELKNLTVNILNKADKIIETALKRICILNRLRESLIIENIDDLSISELAATIEKLLIACRDNGTYVFTQVARLAFIAKMFLKSMVSSGRLKIEEYDYFLNSIKTVAGEMKNDFINLKTQKISVNDFLKKYGHLRPGTYDIRSQRYCDNLKEFFNVKKNSIYDYDGEIDLKKLKKIESKIKRAAVQSGIVTSTTDFIKFLRDAIEQREYIKFEFTKTLSAILEIIKVLSNKCGIDIEAAAYLSINEIISLKKGSLTPKIKKFIKKISARDEYHRLTEIIIQPSIALSEEDFFIIKEITIKPNFITNNIIKGEIFKLEEVSSRNYEKMKDKIVLLEKADPGYDWIFLKGLKGLVTKYGGVASHMSIRCAEFNLPAAIGVGDNLYKKLMKYQAVMLDCRNKKLEILY